ncbi:MAG: fibronectin type III domain-containing protein [Lachnospiraceae bacterium]|nr:fibronectin type III domain-containing protein [Lachnospiraceae bacterium]
MHRTGKSTKQTGILAMVLAVSLFCAIIGTEIFIKYAGAAGRNTPVTFRFKGRTAKSITLSWKAAESATGYQIFRSEGNGAEALVATTTALLYKDKGLKSGTTYRYRIRAYHAVTENTGAYSEKLSTTTLPAKPVIKVRSGNQCVRITWSPITGASGYHIYQYKGAKSVPVATIAGKSNVTCLINRLENGVAYQFAVTAYRNYKGMDYESVKSSVKSGEPVAVAKTSTKAKFFKTRKTFLKSEAVQSCGFLKNNLIYSKSVILPGMINTNVAEFASSSMVPQGLTFAGSYMLVSAYDKKGLDNSVIYVMGKSGKRLLTTIILPNKTHAGGITCDDKNLWICQSTTLRSIPFSEVEKAAKKRKKYIKIEAYDTKAELGQRASAVTYYKGLLWVAAYAETGFGYMGSYRIVNKDAKPTLALLQRIKIANRVQGLSFTSNGRLIFSRSSQANSSKKGYIHQLDVYKPDMSRISFGIVKPGKREKIIDMPSMNEEIAVSGKYLYVNFESVYYAAAAKQVDRICAFKVTAVTE